MLRSWSSGSVAAYNGRMLTNVLVNRRGSQADEQAKSSAIIFETHPVAKLRSRELGDVGQLGDCC